MINLVDIDWNNLSVEAFKDLHSNLEIKKVNKKRKKIEGESTIKIYDKFYVVPNKLIMRLNSLKNQKSKENLRQEIIANYQPIVEI